jgi:hypothetical protein
MLSEISKTLKRQTRICSTILSQTKPDFIIIGAQKGGTTALFSILDQHSHLRRSSIKEVNYFNNDKWYNKAKLFQYHSYFPPQWSLKKGHKTYEATPSYFYHPEVAQRLSKYRHDLKLIVVLRNPVYRAFSAWAMYHHHFKTGSFKHLHDPRTFKQAIDDEFKVLGTDHKYDETKGYINRGLYAQQLKVYLHYFSMDQILILENTEIINDFDETSNRLFQFLDVPNELLKLELKNKSKVDDKAENMDTLKKLASFFEPHNDSLFNMLGKAYNWD